MGLIVDASVAVKWFIDEPGSAAAHRLLGDDDLLAPDLLVVEVGNTARRLARLGELPSDQCDAIVACIGGLLELHPTAPLAQNAMVMARTLDHPIYDCFYLALAEREQLPLITADRRFLSKLPGSPWQDRGVALDPP